MFPQAYLSRILSAAAITVVAGSFNISATPASAGPAVDPTCMPVTGLKSGCVPMVGCIGKDGVYFVGRSMNGNGSGTFSAQTSTGASCLGTWDFKSKVTRWKCSDGSTGAIVDEYQESATGTSMGLGETDEGFEIRAWSGRHVSHFLLEFGQVKATTMCAR